LVGQEERHPNFKKPAATIPSGSPLVMHFDLEYNNYHCLAKGADLFVSESKLQAHSHRGPAPKFVLYSQMRLEWLVANKSS